MGILIQHSLTLLVKHFLQATPIAELWEELQEKLWQTVHIVMCLGLCRRAVIIHWLLAEQINLPLQEEELQSRRMLAKAKYMAVQIPHLLIQRVKRSFQEILMAGHWAE